MFVTSMGEIQSLLENHIENHVIMSNPGLIHPKRLFDWKGTRYHWSMRRQNHWRGSPDGWINHCMSLCVYGSRSKTHARLLVSEWHLHIWMYVFAAVAKDRERAAKGSRKVWTPLFINTSVIVIVFMLGRFLAESPQDPCLGLYAASIQHFDRYLCRVM